MEFSNTQQGKPLLIYHGYEYIVKRQMEDITTWRCKHYNSLRCLSHMKTKTDTTIIQEPTTHSHDSFPQKSAARLAVVKMKNKMKEVGASPKVVVGSILTQVNEDVMQHLPKATSLLRRLRSVKRTSTSHSTSLTTQFEIPDEFKSIILFDTGGNDTNRILALGDLTLVQELNKHLIIGDGTFDKATSMFYQLFTWHAKVGNSYPPCIYFLVQKKDQEMYDKMFEILLHLLPDLSPKEVLVDYNLACMNAARNAFPQASIKGTYFHLLQGLIRRINQTDLKESFLGNIEEKLRLKSLAALSFVPEYDVQNVYDMIAETFPNEESYNDILGYFQSNYIRGVIPGRDALFPTSVWNHNDTAQEFSTKIINCCQDYHSALNAIFHCSNPSVCYLLTRLQQDMTRHKLTLVKSEALIGEQKTNKYELLHKSFATIVQNYETEPDKLKYLRTLANLQ